MPISFKFELKYLYRNENNHKTDTVIIPCKFQHFNKRSIVCCFRYKMDSLKSSEIITYWGY